MDRHSFFRDGLAQLASSLLKSPVGRVIDQQLQGLANLLAPQKLQLTPHPSLRKELYARPPGALADEEQFDSACTLCGDCIQACPYGTILDGGSAGPLIDPDTIACHLCPDFPCQKACKEGALMPLPKQALPRFGKAEPLPMSCLNWEKEEKKCDYCLTACPVEGAIRFNKEDIPQFGKLCTGCGLCKAACPARPVAIRIETGA